MWATRNAWCPAESPDQGLPQRGQSRTQPAPREVGQGAGIGGAGHQSVEYCPAGDAEHSAGDRGELDARILVHLMQPAGLSGALLNERVAVAREIPQLPNRGWRHEALPDEAVLEQLGDPHAVLHIGLPAGDLGRSARRWPGYR